MISFWILQPEANFGENSVHEVCKQTILEVTMESIACIDRHQVATESGNDRLEVKEQSFFFQKIAFFQNTAIKNTGLIKFDYFSRLGKQAYFYTKKKESLCNETDEKW